MEESSLKCNRAAVMVSQDSLKVKKFRIFLGAGCLAHFERLGLELQIQGDIEFFGRYLCS